jgi:hypothetical protein
MRLLRRSLFAALSTSAITWIALPTSALGAQQPPDSSPANAPSKSSPVAFIPDQPLGYGEKAGGIQYYDIQMSIDGTVTCTSADIGNVQADDDWVCKGDATPGSHDVSASIRADTGATWSVSGSVELSEAERTFEYPDRPDSGEKFWCVLVSKARISLLPRSDPRCHTD